MQSLEQRFLYVRANVDSNGLALHKPLLLLYALGRLINDNARMLSFSEVDKVLNQLLKRFHYPGSLKSNTHYPFGKLENDGIWEVEHSANLMRTSAGHLLKTELLFKNIHAGFTPDVFTELVNNKSRALSIAQQLTKKYFPSEQQAKLLEAVGLAMDTERQALIHVKDEMGNEPRIEEVRMSEFEFEKDQTEIKQNSFIAYLNSLHNLGASGANALAESQALNPYFGEIYEPFPLIDKLAAILTDGTERVVVLTGHAGDGKSTVALDILKKLRGLPPMAPLDKPLEEREEINAASGRVTIVKDMSELSAERRQQWLHQAFSESGSWLIISNTGPLLHSLVDYAKESGFAQEIESMILDRLARSFGDGPLDGHSLDGFKKELVILNLTRLDNVALGAKILTKLVTHSAWEQCGGCNIEPVCPLMLNRKALRDAGPLAEERVRWIYRRLNAYEQRLTLRQIVAQLALGLTGGMSCDEAQQQVTASTAEGSDRGSAGLERIVFSEGFFGYRSGKPWLQAEEGLHAVALVRRLTFGAPVGVDFERRLPSETGIGWAILPPSLDWLGSHWRQRAAESAGVRWRFALRRMAYLFGKVAPGRDQSAAVFLDTFLQSPSLREFDQWQEAKKLTLSRADANRLRTSCLRVLLEIFSGFSASQFHSKHDALYLTLRRPDQAVVQPTQLVIETLPFRAFELRFQRTPVLSFDRGRAEVVLSLPLLDYIRRRDAGELGNELSPVHQAQLDWFRAELLRVTSETRHNRDEIELLRAGIDGEVHLHRFLLDQDRGILEQV